MKVVERPLASSEDVSADPLVNCPPHYTVGSMETIEAIEGLDLDYHRGNAVKYIARAPHKGEEKRDIEKAIWYLRRYLQVAGLTMLLASGLGDLLEEVLWGTEGSLMWWCDVHECLLSSNVTDLVHYLS